MLWGIRTGWQGSPESSRHVLCAQDVLISTVYANALSLLSGILLAQLERFQSKVAAEVICSLNF